MKEIIKKSSGEIKKINYEILQKMSDLAIAGFGLVAALAWNDAIKALFDAIFPKTGGIIAQFVYAAVITIVIVFVTLRLGKIVNLAKEKFKDEDKQ